LACGAVHRTPYAAVRALLTWAIELWPYVNGACILRGFQLKELLAGDMLDVIHYLFEEDINYSSGEQAEARSKARSSMYSDLYQGSYSYGVAMKKEGYNYDNGSTVPTDGYYEDDDIKPYDPDREPLKPYIPPTTFDEGTGLPLDNTILDAPLN